MDDPALPYGIRDIKLTPMDSDGSLGTPVDLPVGQTLSFAETEEYETLRGDDRDVAIHGKGAKVKWSLEAGGISLEAWVVLTGGTLTETGSTPNQEKKINKKVTDARPYFRIEGQAINDVDGDTHVVIYKAKMTEDLEGEFGDGQFFITKCGGEGIGDVDGNLYDFIWNETEEAIANGGTNEMQLVVLNAAAGGTFTLTYSAQTTATIAYDASAATVQSKLEALSNIAVGDVVVTGDAGGPWYVEFTGALAEQNVSQMTLDPSSLTGTGATGTVATVRAGAAPA